MNSLIIIFALTVTLYLAFSKRLAQSSNWKATVTPLASIMGSGFLVSAPLLASAVGYYAVFCLLVLLIIAYAVGHAIRFNIRYFEPIASQPQLASRVAFVSRIVLAAAYFISITYYLELLAAFVLNLIGIEHDFLADMITSTLLITICGVGLRRGLTELEKLETYAVSLNLGMIAGLIVALLIYNLQRIMNGDWTLPAVPSNINLHDFRVLLGLLIVVQGFETSRYLQETHPAEQRIRTMRYAQISSSVIYLVFISLITVLFQTEMQADVTAITQLVAPVAVVLPVLIAIAAMGSQFSAAVADTSGAGGLIKAVSQQAIASRYVYLLILGITLVLTWSSNVNEIIAYASRAFALFYCLQCLVAFLVAKNSQNHDNSSHHRWLFALTGLICLLVFIFGIPAES